MSSMSVGTVVYPIALVVGLIFLFFYLKNLFKAAQAVRDGRYTVRTALRVIGIFIIFLGVAMGFVKGV